MLKTMRIHITGEIEIEDTGDKKDIIKRAKTTVRKTFNLPDCFDVNAWPAGEIGERG